jgi:indole-3-acetate monooxygenase
VNQLLSISDRLIHEVRESAASIESSGSLSPRILDYIYDAKLFKLFVPAALGGLGAGLPDALRVFEKAAWVDGSFGWLVTIGAGGGFFAATLPPEQSRKLFGERKAVVAGSGHANGIAKPVDGGYRVSGQWKYSSGSTYASIFTANCRIESALGEAPEIRSFVFMPEQVKIIRDWKSFGLKATDSHSIAVEEVYVPAERTFDIFSTPRYADPIFRYPFVPFAQTSFAAVCIGLCHHFLEEARSFAAARQDDWGAAQPKRLTTLVRMLDEKQLAFKETAERFYDTVDRSWAVFTESNSMSELDQEEVGRCSQEAARTALECAHAIFPLLGMAALMEDNLLNRIYRDLHTVTQHTMLVQV